jgi:hypothetical protein
MSQRRKTQNGQPWMPMKDHQRLHKKAGVQRTMMGERKHYARKKTPKKDRNSDTTTAKQITSLVQ